LHPTDCLPSKTCDSLPMTISLSNLLPPGKNSLPRIIFLKLLDRLLSISKMNRLYQQHGMAGLDKQSFAQKLLEVMEIKITGLESLKSNVPNEGPLVIASNHPFGGIEGVLLCWALSILRADLKVMANQGLKLFPELNDYFIFTDPLREKDPKNGPSIRSCIRHVKAGGALLVFPAGRVAYFQKHINRVSEHMWNRIVGRLISTTNAGYLPIFISGQNSALFYRLGRIYYRFRLLMLARELLNKQGKTISISCGNIVKSSNFQSTLDLNQYSALCRALSYAQDPNWRGKWPADKVKLQAPLAKEMDYFVLLNEVSQLPVEQHLLDSKGYSVYFGYQQQLPRVVAEIGRLRELVFRQNYEGSGAALDTDKFDSTYTHLFVMDRSTGQIIGAYRMGQSDILLAKGGLKALYLSRMFKFSPQFINQQQPCLEMGRSFLIPQFQRSYHGLYLLWQGIGAFLCKHPHYRYLYGTVSISKLYDMRSVALIKKAMVTATETVSPYKNFDFPLHPEIQDFCNEHSLRGNLTAFLTCIEADGKGIPILAKHYEKLAAKFHCLGIDEHFNDTPGLLLSVHLPAAPEKLLKLYLGKNWQQYRDWSSTQ
jgi:putative hemolysin